MNQSEKELRDELLALCATRKLVEARIKKITHELGIIYAAEWKDKQNAG